MKILVGDEYYDERNNRHITVTSIRKDSETAYCYCEEYDVDGKITDDGYQLFNLDELSHFEKRPSWVRREEKFCKTREKLLEMNKDNWEIPKMVACIYDLWQNYYIDDDEEDYLYSLADPNDEYNNCSDYWREMNYENPLMKIWE
jgi:hypothetical protein